MASTSQQPLEEAYANLDINPEEDIGLEIDINLVHNPSQYFRWTLIGRLLGTVNVLFELFRQLTTSLWRPVRGVHVCDLGQG